MKKIVLIFFLLLVTVMVAVANSPPNIVSEGMAINNLATEFGMENATIMTTAIQDELATVINNTMVKVYYADLATLTLVSSNTIPVNNSSTMTRNSDAENSGGTMTSCIPKPSSAMNSSSQTSRCIGLKRGTNLYRVLKTCSVSSANDLKTAPITLMVATVATSTNAATNATVANTLTQ